MEGDPHHGNKWMPIMYVTYFGMLKEIAESKGYCLSVHGSVTRDFDLIAIPWTEVPSSHEELLKAFRDCIEINVGEPYDSMCVKPGGRIAYTIMSGGGGYLDISITPFVSI